MNATGYHGTLKRHVESIKKKGFLVSKGNRQWFGDGVYFFETYRTLVSGFEEAKNWVIKVKKCEDWAVFESRLESDNFIDLVESPDHRELFKKVREQARKLHDGSKKRNEPFREQLIYHLLRKKMCPSLIRTFINADKYSQYDYECHTVVHPQIQICVIDTECIKTTRLCQGEGKYE